MNTLKNIRPVWAEINLDNLAHNIKEVKRVSNKNSIITAVVKADGYGHGAKKVSKVFLDNGAERLAVATLSEALELKNDDFNVPILILGYTPSCQLHRVIENELIQTIYTYDQAKEFSDICIKLNKTGSIHIKIDTGMGRLGFLTNENTIKDIIEISKLSNIYLEGIYTHFAKADSKIKDFSYEQFDRFKFIIDELKKHDVKIPIKHVCNSAGIIDLNEFNLDMVRAGIMLYGLYPSDEVNKENVLLKPAMTLKARVSNIKIVPENTGISYGHIYKTHKLSKIGTLPIGYADGFTRLLSNKTFASVNEARVPVIGRICMDQCMIDITDISNVKIGDEVVLFGNGSNNSLHIDEIANILGTINYEVVCMVGKRVPRVYIKNQKIVDIVEYI